MLEQWRSAGLLTEGNFLLERDCQFMYIIVFIIDDTRASHRLFYGIENSSFRPLVGICWQKCCFATNKYRVILAGHLMQFVINYS